MTDAERDKKQLESIKKRLPYSNEEVDILIAKSLNELLNLYNLRRGNTNEES